MKKTVTIPTLLDCWPMTRNFSIPFSIHFLGDVLGSVRQLANESGEIMLAKDYAPYGETLASAGDGASAYGFTGEWTDVTGLVYLRARYYAPWDGRFLSRDRWEGNVTQPMSYNVWLYVNANPVTWTDPQGLYGPEVHKEFTIKAVKANPLYTSHIGLPELISSWDNYVDLGPTLISIGACGACHFMDCDRTLNHIEAAIMSGEPYIFGAVLHQLQDYYSHWLEGYHDQILGHGLHTAIAKIVRKNEDRLESFFKMHPKDEVIRNIMQRNPGIILIGLSDWDLIDLYLRMDILDPNNEEKVKLRDAFGFNPDLYVATSYRDIRMQYDTKRAVDIFIQRLPKKDCYSLIPGLDLWGIPLIPYIEGYSEMEKIVRAYLTR